MASTCPYCTMPMRKRIEMDFLNPGHSKKRVLEYYRSELPDPTIKYPAFLASFNRHCKKHKEVPMTAVTIPINQEAISRYDEYTMENFARGLLNLGFDKLKNMKPEDVKFADVIQSQRLLIERDKLKVSQTAMMLQFTKLFGIPDPIRYSGKTVEGEEVHESIQSPQSGRGQDEGNQQTDNQKSG